MTKQQEVREDTARTFYEGSEISRMISWVDLPQEVRDIFFIRADSYLFRIHSKGVVIKVADTTQDSNGFNHPNIVVVESLLGEERCLISKI
ncbi:hypothetical protein LCGC14_0527470 [marine sediment metagenome]|uniref:Uncharacterized protein n=1 Tax=marine sediment metagenome TaxID=412755 RepID=A0A0F9UI19_9ZZZZ